MVFQKHDLLTTHVCSADFACIDDIECCTRNTVSNGIETVAQFVRQPKDEPHTPTRDVEASW